LERLFNFVLQRELTRHDGDLDLEERALKAIRHGIAILRQSPFKCSKVGTSQFRRELIIPFGQFDCVALFQIINHSKMVVSDVRHQHEDASSRLTRPL
jgi:hypothetical protein